LKATKLRDAGLGQPQALWHAGRIPSVVLSWLTDCVSALETAHQGRQREWWIRVLPCCNSVSAQYLIGATTTQFACNTVAHHRITMPMAVWQCSAQHCC
jgi:hypothetical protein